MAAMLVAVVVVILVALLVLFLMMQSGGSTPAVILVGPCGSGKTVLFYRLTEDEMVETVSSMQVSEAMIPATKSRRAMPLVDVPGHSRLRSSVTAAVARAQCIIFVFDASRAMTVAKPAADLLYSIFATCDLRSPPRILFLCNKADLPGKTPQRVKLMMMDEIETLRKTANTIDIVDETSKKNKIGLDGHFFNFDQHSPCPIDFIPFSGGTTENLDLITDFIYNDSS